MSKKEKVVVIDVAHGQSFKTEIERPIMRCVICQRTEDEVKFAWRCSHDTSPFVCVECEYKMYAIKKMDRLRYELYEYINYPERRKLLTAKFKKKKGEK